ncbi:hypothetical protein D3C77_186170 [compost metagenome]
MRISRQLDLVSFAPEARRLGKITLLIAGKRDDRQHLADFWVVLAERGFKLGQHLPFKAFRLLRTSTGNVHRGQVGVVTRLQREVVVKAAGNQFGNKCAPGFAQRVVRKVDELVGNLVANRQILDRQRKPERRAGFPGGGDIRYRLSRLWLLSTERGESLHQGCRGRLVAGHDAKRLLQIPTQRVQGHGVFRIQGKQLTGLENALGDHQRGEAAQRITQRRMLAIARPSHDVNDFLANKDFICTLHDGRLQRRMHQLLTPLIAHQVRTQNREHATHEQLRGALLPAIAFGLIVVACQQQGKLALGKPRPRSA